MFAKLQGEIKAPISKETVAVINDMKGKDNLPFMVEVWHPEQSSHQCFLDSLFLVSN